MQDLSFIGKMLISLGLIIVICGIVILMAGRIPWIGRLPGDIFVERKNFRFYFPITTSIIVSIILSLIFWFISRIK